MSGEFTTNTVKNLTSVDPKNWSTLLNCRNNCPMAEKVICWSNASDLSTECETLFGIWWF